MLKSRLWCKKRFCEKSRSIALTLKTPKFQPAFRGVSRIFLPTAEAIGTLTASGTRDFVATVALSGCEPNTYKQQFLEEIYYPGQFRSLTAQDYAKLQGFPENFILHPNSSIAKKQFGNAVSVPVIAAIAQSILQCL